MVKMYDKKTIRWSLLQLVLCFFLTGSVWGFDNVAAALSADAVGEVRTLLKQKKYAQAESRATFYLSQNPNNLQMRLLYGAALTEQGKDSQAIVAFQALIRSHPDLPEAYNNLAALHAEGKQYDRAREALEQGIATNPSYNAIHKNLGMIYAQMARKAYEKALQVPEAKQSSGVALVQTYELASGKQGMVTATDKAVTALTTPASSRIKVVETPSAAKGGRIKLPTVDVQIQPEKVTQREPKPSQSSASNEQAISSEEAVKAAVMRWAGAWAAQDLKGYFASYGDNFKPAKGRSRTAWEKFRRSRIENKSKITIKIQNLRVSIDGNKAQARFLQRYRSGSFKVSTNKILQLENNDGNWVIVSEAS